jgi:flavin reductase (DIM6/NTAB) family NADH-FMN oxidoreductase RutF
MPPCADEAAALDSVSPDRFKAAMRHVASTVSVVTSGRDEAINGMTATAVCSVSTEPPSLLIVVNRNNRSHALIDRCGVYTVNVLSVRQESLAAHFSSSADAPFALVPHQVGINKCPIIDGCAFYMECVVESQIAFGTHSIFFGRVVASGETSSVPLLYHDGQYSSLAPLKADE